MIAPPGYRLLGQLSFGRDLEVFEAWSEHRQCGCVIKHMRDDRASDELAARLRLEADLLMKLTHPHVLRAYEFLDEPRPTIVEELLCGYTLGAMLARRPRLALHDLANLLEQLCSAIGYLHTNGYLHLDLKPSNIISDGGRLKLIDFSLAHAPGDGPRGWGTRSYLSTEQATGGAYTTATDVWGIGLVGYIAATGLNPFADGGPSESTSGNRRPYRQSVERPAPVRSLRRLPVELARCIDRALLPDAADRPTVAEFMFAAAAVAE